MINGLYGVINTGVSILKGGGDPGTGLDDIHKNRIKNEIEQLKLNQCKLEKCRDAMTFEKTRYHTQYCHFHVNNVIMYDKENRKNYVLIDISIMIEDVDTFLSNEIPVQIILYKDFPFSPPDITFPSTFCFPSLSDGRSFTAEILHEWSPSINLLAIVESIVKFLKSYNTHIAVVGPSDMFLGSFRNPISFNYQCYNSLVYPILGTKIIFEDEVFKRIFENNSIKGQNVISQKGRNLISSFIPIPLNTRGLRRETMNWRIEKPYINIDFVFNSTNVMLFDSTMLVLEVCQKTQQNGIIQAKNPSKTSSSSDEIISDSTLQGNVAYWLYLSAISHIIDCDGKLIFGNQGTLPEYISDKLSKLEYSECLVLVLGYDFLFEKSSVSFYQNEELIQTPKDSTRPIIIELKFHTSKANHESSCCHSFATNLREKVVKLDSNFPQNCHNPKWNSYFEFGCLSNLNKKYQQAITENHMYLSSEIIQRWVVICTKLIEQSSFLSETDERYIQESSSLVKQMQDILISPVVKHILNSDAGKPSKVNSSDEDFRNDTFYNHLEEYSPENSSKYGLCQPEPHAVGTPHIQDIQDIQEKRALHPIQETQPNQGNQHFMEAPHIHEIPPIQEIPPIEGTLHTQEKSPAQEIPLIQEIPPSQETPHIQGISPIKEPSPIQEISPIREIPPIQESFPTHARLINLDTSSDTEDNNHLDKGANNFDEIPNSYRYMQIIQPSNHKDSLQSEHPNSLFPSQIHFDQNYISLYESSSDEFSVREFE
ncbi:UBC domain containing [Cryptosporidium sp. chipmunk genotype I]|uniref:UBC domain containing n=1 Tax=Cryptosporidium sp. chipmunk genotype I TaxID=1280935 RepID=UPI00351A870A|nr:UBC domain containing [Cryptosporidium sp. chipmunk genotype I]